MEAVIFIGIQASGKSQFYKERFFNSHVRISLDLLKTRAREDKLLTLCLESGQPFVIDNTNPRLENRSRYILLAKQHGYRVVGYFFEPNVAESLRRNEMRSASAIVPKVAIFATFKRLQAPELAEGFDELFVVRSAPENTFSVEVVPGRAASTP
jgi:predicted kinase